MPTTEDPGNTIVRPEVTLPTLATEAPTTQKMTDSTTGGPPPMKTTTEAAGPLQPSPGGIIYVSATSYKLIGGKSPVPNTCYFLNQTFSKGEHWKDTCRYDCECFDTNTNTELCSDVCPHYTSIPNDCTIVTVDGECCPSVVCGNNTSGVNNTIDVTGSGSGSDCGDMLEQCDYYEDNACVGLYEPWARAHCALRCGYCDYKAPCVDRLTYCSLYELDTACQDYSGWARHNCKRSCSMCT